MNPDQHFSPARDRSWDGHEFQDVGTAEHVLSDGLHGVVVRRALLHFGRGITSGGVFDDARTFVSEYQSGADLDGLIQQAWDLPKLEDAYDEFLDAFTDPDPHGDPLARLIDLVHTWRRFPWQDPILPRELLPTVWHGERAAELFTARRTQWHAAAPAQWSNLED